MSVTAIAAAVLSLAATGEAPPKDKVSDADYLAAARCQGLAVGAGAKDGALDSFVRRATRGRNAEVAQKAGDAFDAARREGGRDRAAAQSELNGACLAFRAPAAATSAAN